jgi:hypothetical protein
MLKYGVHRMDTIKSEFENPDDFLSETMRNSEHLISNYNLRPKQ